MIIGLFPKLSGAGGIQLAGRLTAAALSEFAAQQRTPCQFLSLNDPPGASVLEVGEHQVDYVGFLRSKSRFFQSAWNAARPQPSLLVAFHPNLAPVAAAIKFAAPKTRTAVFSHGIEVWAPLPFIRRRSLHSADVVFAPSQDTADKLAVHQGLPNAKVRKLPWSLGPEFDPSRRNGTKIPAPQGFPKGKIILTVGRWDASEAYKGVDHLIRALPELIKIFPDLYLVAIGSGTDLPRLKQLAQEACLAERVRFLDSLSHRALASAYDACDVFALPSRGEGFGLVFIEAMSHGKPVIGGAHGGTPDIVEDGSTGYLVRYGDIDQLTDRLGNLLADASARTTMGARARERVCREYTFERFSGNLAVAIQDILP
jgi:glycosyltransferase involved in cell wall biosynthesis